MDRRDAQLNGMLRHLGAAYYESLHGRASASDVARALGSVEEHIGEPPAAAAGRGWNRRAARRATTDTEMAATAVGGGTGGCATS